MEFIYKHADWSNINVLERNRLPMRPFYCGYQTVKEARIGKKEESGKYRLLNGIFSFCTGKRRGCFLEQILRKNGFILTNPVFMKYTRQGFRRHWRVCFGSFQLSY